MTNTSNIIKEIAYNPILINQKCSNILHRIADWIEYIFFCGNAYLKLNHKLSTEEIDADFTFVLKRASLGTEYKKWKIIPHDFHAYGETWSYDELVLCSNTGLIDWYCNYFSYSETEYLECVKNLEICTLGACFHRLKIIMENIYKIIDFVIENKNYEYYNMTNVKKLLHKTYLKEKNSELFGFLEKIAYIDKEKLMENYLVLESLTDLIQQKIFRIIKTKSWIIVN